MTVGRLW